MAKRSGWFIVVTAVVVTGLAYSGLNQASEDHERAKGLRESGEILPLEQILERAGRDQPGRVLESELEHEGGRYVYELEILDKDGVSHKLYYDARDGSRLKQKRDD